MGVKGVEARRGNSGGEVLVEGSPHEQGVWGALYKLVDERFFVF